MQENLRPFSLRPRLIARLLDPACRCAEAALLVEELARAGGLARLLHSTPHHRIGPALAERIRALGIDTGRPALRPARGLLDHVAASCNLRNQLLRSQLKEVVSLLAERGIRLCLIKGAISLADDVPDGYLSPMARPMEDLDIVVGPNDREAAIALMRERGWLCTSGTQRVPFSVDAPALVDVRPWAPSSPALGFLGLDDFFAGAAATTVGGRAVRALKPQKAVQLRLAHNVIRQHLFIDFPLLDLYEISSIIAAYPTEIDWAGIRSVGLMNDVSRIFYAILLRLRDEFGAPVPENAIPPSERGAAARVLRLLETLAAVPDRLYGAASRFALIASAPGRFMDTVNRACTVLFSEPLGSPRCGAPLTRLALPVRMLAGHVAVCCWKMLRG